MSIQSHENADVWKVLTGKGHGNAGALEAWMRYDRCLLILKALAKEDLWWDLQSLVFRE